jgi:hypothetical protein
VDDEYRLRKMENSFSIYEKGNHFLLSRQPNKAARGMAWIFLSDKDF